MNRKRIGPPAGEESKQWNGGTSLYSEPYLFKKRSKEIRRQNPVCQNCGSNPSTEIHHIDESKTNHSYENLIAVCHSCNIRLATNKKPRNYYVKLFGISPIVFAKENGIPKSFLYRKLKDGLSLKNVKDFYEYCA